MLGVTQCTVAVLLTMSLVDAAPYSKYGRTCRDIGCLSNEVCVMNEDPCTSYASDQCGRYPTCKRSTEMGDSSCTTMICPSGQYCKTQNGRPTCVNTVSGLGYDSAGVSSVNGRPSQTNVHHDTPSVPSNPSSYPQNPYANANAPPIPNPGHNYPVNSATNLGYPPYPSNTGSGTGSSNGYPAYPSYPGASSGSGTNLGYPPYPTHNKMPVPGQTQYPQSNYPAQSYPGYPQQNNYPQQYPGYQQHYPTYQNRGYSAYNTRNGYRKNGSSLATPAISMLFLSLLTIAKYFY